MKSILLTVHRYISLAMVLVWILQGITGTMMVFKKEIMGLNFKTSHEKIDFSEVEKSLELMVSSNEKSRIPFVYASDNNFNNLNVYFVDKRDSWSLIRMDAKGSILRTLPSNPEVMDAGFFELVLELHVKRFSGEIGKFIISISGILLLTNLLIGLKLAWPGRGTWLRSFKLTEKPIGRTGVYKWHRTLGLWFIFPAIIIIGAGTLMIWEDDLENIFGPNMPAPHITQITPSPEKHFISMTKAIEIAQSLYPLAKVSFWTMASNQEPYYKVRLLQEEELPTTQGMTTLYIDAIEGKILANYNALKSPTGVKFLNSFYPIHNGEFLGIMGRIIVFLVGIWLTLMIVLGISLWWVKKTR